MKSIAKFGSILMLLVFFAPLSVTGQTLSDNLKILEPLSGKSWTGEMRSIDGQKLLKTERNFQVVWGGTVVKFASSVPELQSFSEGYFYWDKDAQKIAAFVISSRGVVQRGFVSTDKNVITVEGKIIFPERSFDYKNTFELRPDGTMVDRWFQNAFGPWQPGHVVELKAQQK